MSTGTGKTGCDSEHWYRRPHSWGPPLLGGINWDRTAGIWRLDGQVLWFTVSEAVPIGGGVLWGREKDPGWERRDEKHKPLLLMSTSYSRRQENQVTPRTDMHPVLGECRGGRVVTQTKRMREDMLTQAISELRTYRV